MSRLTGFDTGVDVAHAYADVEIDFRNRRGDPSKGFYFRALAGGAPPQFRDVAFGHYGMELKAFIDLFDESRILVLRGALDAVHGDEDAIPFSELPRLGGPHRLRGYRLNRFRDRRALVGTVEYRYPIHQYIGGHLFVDIGRVAPTYEELFDPRMDQWRTGYGGGFRVRTRNRHFFRIDFAYGKDFLVFFTTDAVQAFTDEHLLEF